MTDLNKNPMKNPDYRFFWWEDYARSLKMAASNLEDELSDLFRFNKYGEEPDNEASVVNLIHSGMLALAQIAQKQADKNRKNLSQYEKFCEYWVFGRGEWHGLHEFLQQEAE